MKPPIKIQLDNINKKPSSLPLTDNPRSKEPNKIPLKTNIFLDLDNENNNENNSQSIQQLDTESTD